jgi:Na+-driven multidrug efflux pump
MIAFNLVDTYFIGQLGTRQLVVPMVGNNAIWAAGDTKTPSLIMLAAVGINIVLDPLLISGFGPFSKMGLQGTALATAISRGVMLVVALYELYFQLDQQPGSPFQNTLHLRPRPPTPHYITLPTQP